MPIWRDSEFLVYAKIEFCALLYFLFPLEGRYIPGDQLARCTQFWKGFWRTTYWTGKIKLISLFLK